MRPFASVLLLTAVLAPAARAQSSSEPSLAFTISGGLTTGQKLWNIDNQRLVAPGGAYDTVRLGRRLVPGLQASLGMSYFRSVHWGLNAEISYFGLSSEQECFGPAAYVADGENLNKQACENAHGRSATSSVIAFMGGAMYQMFDSARVRPFLRVNAGVGLLGASFVETVGIVRHTSCNPISPSDNICPYAILSERNKPSATFVVSLAGGFTMALGPGYRIRMEGRDLILQLPRVTGPANPTATGNIADSKRVLKHVPVFQVGFDVMLERRRARRY